MTIPSFETQMAAWQRYADARRKADQTLSFEDGRDAADAFKEFLNVYLDDDRKLPTRSGGGNVAIFPVHKTRSPAPLPRGGA
ncbi:hypothetical protein U8C37_06830 [Sinorhizobium medicae]|uniref:hypothetical protein n=1 Tax=Sinorhizobium medicae TaxID=110321 RepID=UPI002AF6C2D6|nr:hypothetical protein [Sinorhizobium medicae]WQO87083.1 hypothetical protein U8C37_06830 [Sinorhizobium medicae]